MREVVFENDGESRTCAAARYERTGLLAGNRIEGPAVVSQLDSTTIIPPGAEVEVDRFGNLIAALAGSETAGAGCRPRGSRTWLKRRCTRHPAAAHG